MMASPRPEARPGPTLGADVVRTIDGLIAGCPHDPAAIETSCMRVEQLARLRLLRAFQDEGAFLQSGEQAVVADLKKRLHVAQRYERLFDVLIEMLAHGGFLNMSDGRATVAELPDSSSAACAALREAVLADHPDRAILIRLLEASAPETLAVVTGRKSAVEVLFPGGSAALVEDVYANDLVSTFFNVLTAHAAEALVRSRLAEQPGGRVSVLEIGAGTGGTSVGVLDRLAPMSANVVYHYTDISPALLQGAQSGVAGAHPNVRFRALDIGRDPAAQGFEAGGSDVVIAANVLHATRNIDVTLANVRKLLRRGGVLVLSEVTRTYHFTTLTFGLTHGWWLFEDAGRIPGSPLLSVGGWRRALTAAGFSDVRCFTPFTSDPDQPAQSLILAVRGGGDEPAPVAEHHALIWKQLQIIEAQLDVLRAKRLTSFHE
jgi:SAM-dependent methyltransferase